MRKQMFHSTISRVALTLGLAVLFLAVAWIVFDIHGANAGNRLTIGTTDSILSLDPAGAYDFHSWEILRNVGSGLLNYVPGTTDLTPGLAVTMPQVSSDGLVYTFTLRSGLQFPDGTPFDADAVKWSVDRVVDLGATPSWLITEFVSDVVVIDNATVRFTLKQESALFPHLVASVPYYPVSPNCFPEDQLAPGSTCGGMGSYIIDTWSQGSSIGLKANSDYYGPQPKTSSIVVRYFDGASEMRQALEDGGIDIAWKTLRPTDYQDLRTDLNFNVVEGGGSYIRYLCFNTTASPFDDIRVRTAIAAAIERETIAQDVYSGTMSALYSMVPEGVWSHRDAFFDLYGQRNLTQTRTLLRQAGYSETNELALDLWYPLEHYGPQEPDFAAELAEDIEETGMVSVTLHSEDWSTYAGNLGAGTMPVFLLGWWPDYLDPDNYTWPFAHSGDSDDLGIFYSNAEMDNLLKAGRSRTPVQGPAREAIYVDIQDLWAEEAPTIPLLQGKQLAVAWNGIREFRLSPLGTFPYSTIEASASETIDPGEGGSLASYHGDTVVQIPAGAVTETVVVTHTRLSAPSPGGNLSSIDNVFDLTAVYTGTDPGTAGLPAQIAPGYTYTITAQYTDTELGLITENTLGLYWWDEDASAWSQQGVTSSVNVTDDLVTAQVNHFSRFAVLGETHRVYLPVILRSH